MVIGFSAEVSQLKLDWKSLKNKKKEDIFERRFIWSFKISYPVLLTAMLPIDIAAAELLLGKWIFNMSYDGGTPKVTICLGIWMCKSLNLINLSS